MGYKIEGGAVAIMHARQKDPRRFREHRASRKRATGMRATGAVVPPFCVCATLLPRCVMTCLLVLLLMSCVAGEFVARAVGSDLLVS